MIKYYKLEQRDNIDMKKTRTVYKLLAPTYSGKQFIHSVAQRRSFSETVITAVLSDVAEEMAYLLGQGKGVTLPGIGTFTPGIRLKEARKEQLEDEQEAAAKAEEAGDKPQKVTEPNARNLELHHINFRKDKKLFRDVAYDIRREEKERVWGSAGSKITTEYMTQKERIAACYAFLEKNQLMHVSDYAEITGLSKSSAQRELRELVKLENSRLTSRGSGTHKVYMLKKSQTEA